MRFRLNASRRLLRLPAGVGYLALGILLSVGPAAHAATLSKLYSDALSHDSELKSAREAYLVEKQNVPIARAQLLPRIDASAGYDSIKQTYRNATDLFSDAQYRRNDASISLSQPIYQPELTRSYHESERAAMAAWFELQSKEQGLASRLLQAIGDVIRAQDEVRSMDWQLGLLNQQLEQANRLLKEGMATITDVLQYQTQISLIKSRQLNARAGETRARQTLSTYIGHVPLDTPVFRPASNSRLRQLQQTPLNALINRLLTNNTALKAARLRQEAAVFRVGAEKAGHLPRVGLDASVTRSENLDGFNKGTSNDQRVGVSLNVPLFHGMETASRIDKAKHQARQSEHEFNRLRNELLASIKSSHASLMAGFESQQLLAKAKDDSNRALDATIKASRAGTRTARDVQSAMQDWHDASQALLANTVQLVLDGITILQLTGDLNGDEISKIDAAR